MIYLVGTTREAWASTENALGVVLLALAFLAHGILITEASTFGPTPVLKGEVYGADCGLMEPRPCDFIDVLKLQGQLNIAVAKSAKSHPRANQPESSAKQFNHLVSRVVDVNLHRLTSLCRLPCLDGSKNVGMSDPARYGLSAKGIETSHIVERQIELIGHPLVAG